MQKQIRRRIKRKNFPFIYYIIKRGNSLKIEIFSQAFPVVILHCCNKDLCASDLIDLSLDTIFSVNFSFVIKLLLCIVACGKVKIH